ncbi:MAG: T9SS type A sorting domain-containing protein [Bacteroidales bacterium]|nr:T9SS type A sorting domain-containing protein [Bacteroidales bacterium]
MKKILLFLFAMLASSGLFSQIVLLNENMDSYATNSFLGVDNPTWFTTWSNLPGSGEDAQILTNFAHSGTKAASADLTGGQTDCILKLGNKTTERYEVKWWMYVETNKCAYYNFQHFETPGIEWAFEIYFRTNGAIHLYAGGNTINGTYPKATWFEVKQIIKLDVDSIYLYINGALLNSWPFHWTNSSTTGTNQLGAVDLFAGEESGSGETPGFYFDDVVYSQLGTLAPTVVTMPATAVASVTATLNGTVNANIQSTTVSFEYGLTTAYGTVVAGVPGTVTGNTTTPVSANLTGLLPGATYHYRVRGVNSNGNTNGLDMTFTTAPILPVAITTAATSVTSTGATLNGTVDAGGAPTTVTFDYGLTSAYGTTVAGTPNTVTGNGATPVSATITGLTVNTTYHYRVKSINSVGTGNGLDMTFLTTSCPMPSPAGVITGPANACGNSIGNVYSVPPIANATGYIWTVPTGSTITSGANTNSITVTLGTTSGNVSVMGTNSCGNGSSSIKAISVSPAPTPTISGNSLLCQGLTNVVYTTQSGMTNYVWTVSSGGIITAGGTATSNTVTITWSGSGAQTVSVNYTNASGCSAPAAVSFPVTVNPAPVPTIGSTNDPCVNTTNNTYFTESGMNNYVWNISTGGVITSGSGTNTTHVSWNVAGMQWISVSYTNTFNCAATTATQLPVFVNPVPGVAGPITGITTICAGTNGVAYSCEEIFNATSYTWTLPAGATIATGAGTKNITVNYSATAVSGNITVAGTNNCGNGQDSPPFPVTVNPLPSVAGTITGPVSICAGATGVSYSVNAIPNANTYVWTVPSGAIITAGSTSRSILVTFGSSPATGAFTVKGVNACGDGAVSPDYNVTVNEIPAAPEITAVGPVLTSSASTGNQWYYGGVAIAGATNQTYTVTNNTGYYWCVVTLNGCASPISNKIWIEVVGIEELPASASFSVYPVPNDGLFTATIQYPVETTFTIMIYNQIGSKIFEFRDVKTTGGQYQKTIDLRPIPTGIYSVVFLNSESKVIRKILVNK